MATKNYILLTIAIIIIAILTIMGKLYFSYDGLVNQHEEISYNRDVRPILSDKCFACHGPDANKRKAGLRLDLESGALAELPENKGHFAIVSGNPEKSELIKRIESVDPKVVMPAPESNLPRLTAEEVDIVRKWIKNGAKYEKHWAFVPPLKSELPEVRKEQWVKNEIDNFVLQKIEDSGLKPNIDASKETLIKRAFVDLIGLAPEYEEIEFWANNSSDNWYEQLLDTLFQKSAYGEKMAIFWLDLARYADSFGFQDDNIRTQWPWRDWVIHAFNQNMPYDRFLIWQLAGDLMPDATNDNILATAFLRNHKYTEEGGVIDEEYRVFYNVDKTKTYGKAILGMTIECAQCHDHKYDPFSQKDYYQLYAFFNQSREIGYEGDVGQSTPAKNPKLFITNEERKALMPYINAVDTSTLQVSVMGDSTWRRPTYILSRGSYDAPTDVRVFPVALESIMSFDTLIYPQNRLGLAQWTVNKNNPLTARVFVNFIWQEFFGKGLVKTAGDFGLQGQLPTHPELLDWLAVDFMERNWDIKYLVKKIMTSGTYRQSAEINTKQLEVDPENNLYARSPRVRYKAEMVRDWVLSSSGLLNPEIGGPSVKPYQPKGIWESATSGRGVLATYRQDHGPDLYRRGMYTFIKLTAPPPSMMIFDASNRDECEAKRTSTNTPLQALVMLNDPTVLEAARVMAERISILPKNLDEKVEQVFKSILVRNPSEFEKESLLKYCENQLKYFEDNPGILQSTLNTGEYRHPIGEYNLQEAAALMKTILIIYNLEETITKT